MNRLLLIAACATGVAIASCGGSADDTASSDSVAVPRAIDSAVVGANTRTRGKNFTGEGPTSSSAEANADAMCDAWITSERAAGRNVVEDDRTRVTNNQGQGVWTCNLHLTYHEE